MKLQADVLFIAVMAFALILSIAIVSNLQASLQPLYNSTGAQKVAVQVDKSMKVFQNAIVFIYFALCISSIILAFFTESSPLFIIVGVILLPLQLLISFVLHDVFVEFVSTSDFAWLVQNPLIANLFLNLPLISLIVSIIILVVLYAK